MLKGELYANLLKGFGSLLQSIREIAIFHFQCEVILITRLHAD